jgi:RNA polymerase sigma-70 factor
MGSEQSIRSADDATLARACLEDDPEALAEFARRHDAALRAAFENGRREWGDLSLPPEEFFARVAQAASREVSRFPIPGDSLAAALSRLALADLYLASACANGHDAGWRRFDASFRTFLSAVVRSMARTPRDTEEILAGLYSDLFFPRRRGGVETPSSLARYGGRASLRTWLRSVLFTRVRDFYSRRRRSPQSLDLAHAEGESSSPGSMSETDRALLARDLPDESAARRDLVRLVAAALEESLDRLEPEERLAFHAHFVEERTVDEIARLFRAHRATIGRRLKRARTKIVRTIEARLRLDSGAAKREFRSHLPDLAKEMQFDWGRALDREGDRR